MKYIKQIIALIITLACFNNVLQCQDLVGPQLNRPSVEFLSPQTYEFVKYGNLPVSHFNGEADVKIPIYTYSDKDFTIPLFLGYNSSGFMPSKRESIVGLNWFLNSGGGVITRKVNNRPDEREGDPLQPFPELHGYYYAIKNNLITNKTKAELFEPANGNIINAGWWTVNNCELEPDDFMVSIPGYSGSFFIENNGNVKTSGNRPFKVDLSGFGIQLRTSQMNLPVSTIVITTDDGYKYTFGGTLQYLEVTFGMVASNDDTQTINAGLPVIDAWHLKEIQAPNGRTVTYEFENFSEGFSAGYPIDATHYLLNKYDAHYKSKTFTAMVISEPGWIYRDRIMSTQQHADSVKNLTKTVYLKKILVRNSAPNEAHTTIEFNNAEKTKRFYRNVPDIKFSQKNLQLNSISVKDHGTIIKQFDLGYRYFGGTHDRQFLTSLKEVGSGGAGYNFYYHKVDPRISSTPIQLPDPRTHAIDHWGFWNAGTPNQTLFPDIEPIKDAAGVVTGDMLYLSTERDPDVSKPDIGLLAKLVYPTQGFTEFHYEPNSYGKRLERRNEHNFLAHLYNVSGSAGGARIKIIKDYDGDKIINEREFLYVKDYPEGGNASSGILLSWPRYAVYWRYNNQSMTPFINQVTFRLRSSSFNSNYYPGENFIHYSQVTEVLKPSNGFIQYKFNSYENTPNTADIDSHVVLPFTQEFIINVHAYNNYVGIKYNDRSSERGLPYEVTHYASKSGGGHYKVKKTKTLYSSGSDFDNFNTTADDYDFCTIGVHQTGGLSQSYKMFFYPVVPLNVTETIYSDEGTKSSITTITHTYAKNGYLLTSEAKLSDGTTQKTKYKYPLDLITNADEPLLRSGTSATSLYTSLSPEIKALADLKLSNIVSSPIEIIKYKNGAAIGATFLEYRDFGNLNFSKKVYPYKLWSIKTTTPVTSFQEAQITKGASWSFSKNTAYGTTHEMSFDHFDSFGNLLQATDKSLSKKSYQWGYDNLYPIAEAMNIPYTDFFYNGFEDSEGTPGIAKAGRKSRPGGYQKSLPGLTYGTYILSYWEKQTDDSWIPRKLEVNVSSNPYLINIPNSIHLDELRFYPKSSTMLLSTYTYDPLIGITSKADANNKFEFYTFDDAERLRLIKDFSGNILKKLEYNFKIK